MNKFNYTQLMKAVGMFQNQNLTTPHDSHTSDTLKRCCIVTTNVLGRTRGI